MIKISNFNKSADNLFGKRQFQKLSNSDNSEEYGENIQIVNSIIRNELTEKQRKCLTMYYRKNMNTVEISKTLKICPSTVWRHIKKAKNKVKDILKYSYKSNIIKNE